MRAICALLVIAAFAGAMADGEWAPQSVVNATTGKVKTFIGVAAPAKADAAVNGDDAHATAAPSPAFSVNLEYAVYTSAGIARGSSADANPKFVASDWLNPPYTTTAYALSGSQVWQDTTVGNATEAISIRSVTARFIDSVADADNAAKVDVVSAAEYAENDGTTSCVIYGFATNANGATGAIWFHEIPNCYGDFIDTPESLRMSDDGSTVAVVVFTNETLPDVNPHGHDARAHRIPGGVGGIPVNAQLQLRAIAAQSGKFVSGFVVPPAVSGQFVTRGVGVSANGRYVVVGEGASNVNAWVVDTTTGKVRNANGSPSTVHLAMGVSINADASILAFGWFGVTLFRWSSESSAYVQSGTTPELVGPTGESYIVYDQVISTNNGNPLLSVGYTNSQANGVAVAQYTLGTSGAPTTARWTWFSPINVEDQNIVSYMAAHEGYVSVTTWGSGNEAANPSPTVLLFGSQSNATLLAYETPGSMFATDVLYDAPSKSVYVVAAGKHVQANEMGNGGDLYAFKIAV